MTLYFADNHSLPRTQRLLKTDGFLIVEFWRTMTVTYSLDVSSASFCGLHRLLFRWKGSIWKSILPELSLWLLFYFLISCCYRYGMNEAQQKVFEELSVFFYTYSDYIPITFLLGFYVSAVFTRWSQYLDNVGWIDSSALLIATYVRGTDEMARRLRRNMLRYLVLTQAMVFRDISSSVKKRFPTMNHLVTAGIMTENELKEFDAIKSPHIKYWVPIEWIFTLMRKARDSKMIESDYIYVDLLEKIRQYRVNVLTLTIYDWVPIPLVYTQVVNIAVRAYFLVALLGRQYLIHPNDTPNGRSIDLFIPIMSIMQFLFYIGWTKVAEVLLNPFGEDDDDFEANWILDRNLQVGLSVVDDCYGRAPELERDVFWSEVLPQPLYTTESAQRQNNPMIGSTNNLQSVVDDALILKPRQRLMSTGIVYGPPKPEELDLDDDGKPIIPVKNHNPMRRCNSVDHYSDSGNSSDHQRHHVLESIRRRFSKKRKSEGRRASASSVGYSDWYERSPNRDKCNGIATMNNLNSNASRNPSVCSSVLYDGIQSPFGQSYVSNFGQSRNNPINESGRGPLDASMLSNNVEQRRPDDEDPPLSPTEKLAQSWAVNELPVIYEERTHSSTGSGSVISENEALAKKDDHPADIKSILSKSLSRIEEEEQQLPFSKTVSFSPSLTQQTSTTSSASIGGGEPDSRSATFCLADDKSDTEDEERDAESPKRK
ncbi:Bestrophin-like protein [Aphelenchoides bicaudatus]|nr:Bestrophin-like protein [Aphelenchoides bicaudatus]